MKDTSKKETSVSTRGILIPLALAQFIASYAASNMNVAINNIAHDLGTNVSGVQLAITVFTLTMAALMIPGSKLTDIWGRKRTFIIGLIIYGAGALVASFANGLPILILGYSLLEGIGSALMIPPIYIITTATFTNLSARARSFGIISAMAGIGAAAGPLIGGLITTSISWRASFILQALAIVAILFLGRKIVETAIVGKKPKFDLTGAILSAVGLFSIVVGILQAGSYGWLTASQNFAIAGLVIIHQGSISPVWFFVGIGIAFLYWFFRHIISLEKSKKEPLLSTKLFHNKVSNLGLITQNLQWLILLGSSFVISVFFQEVRGYNAIGTGLVLTPATIGILISSALAQRFAKRFSQTQIIRGGFVATILGLGLLIFLTNHNTSVWYSVPGLFILGFGVGSMLTSSVNVVQSSFPDKEQGEISGLSRSASNLGSSMGVAIAGTILVSSLGAGKPGYALAIGAMIIFGLIGLGAALFLPKKLKQT